MVFCFQLNGSLTIGTLDGANVEMAEEMGLENIFIFGMTVDEVEILKARGYDAMEFYNKSPELAKVIDQLKDGTFSRNGDPNEFKDVVNNLLYHDRFLTLADFDAYIEAQNRVSETYRVRNYFFLKMRLPRPLFPFIFVFSNKHHNF